MNKATPESKAEIKVSAFIASLIEKSGKSRKAIADEAGLGKPNMISMLKNGETKLPLARLGSFAKAVHTDPAQLLNLCLAEYYPNIWSAIKDHLESSATADELRLVRAIRASTGSPYVACLHPDEQASFEDFLKRIAQATTVH
jgi:transcriptional regulator with XRE-family HTH domain